MADRTVTQQADPPLITDLTGAQLQTLRRGLERAFPDSAKFEMFLAERLERRLTHYVGPADPAPIAYFRVINQALAEGWVGALALEAHRAYAHNAELREIARQIFDGAEPPANEDPPAPLNDFLWKHYNPYHAMEALRESDADFLFGRDRDIDAFIDAIAMNQSKILLALGASGVGKSSLIFAGVLGALNRRARKSGTPWPPTLDQSHQWPQLILTPGVQPVRSLAGAFVRQWIDAKTAGFATQTEEWREGLIDKGLTIDRLIEAADAAFREQHQPAPQRYIVYVDQGEELYTRGGRDPGRDGAASETPQQKEAGRFSELLAEAAGHDRLIVLMSARSDFLGQLQADVRRSEAAPKKLFDAHRKIDISPLSEQGLADIVHEPPRVLGVSYDEGLDAALIEAAREQPGGLPLLSYTLEAMWTEMRERDGSAVLRWAKPAAQGVDIAQKLAERADAFLKAHEAQHPVLRRLFCVRLAHVPHQGEPTRQAALLGDLTEEEQQLVQALSAADQRILVTGEQDGRAVASVAHEALFRAWPGLERWIEERREFYAWATSIAATRKDYEAVGASALLTGRPLELAKSHLEISEADIPYKDAEFIRKSIEADRRHKTAQEEQRRQHQLAEQAALTSQRLFRRTLAGLVATFVLMGAAIVLAIIAQMARNETEVTRKKLQDYQQKALATFSANATDRADAGLGLLYAIEALPDESSSDDGRKNLPVEPLAEVALERAVRSLREKRVLTGLASSAFCLAIAPGASHLFAGTGDGAVVVWDLATAQVLRQIQLGNDNVSNMAVSSDGAWIVTSSGSVFDPENVARLWDAKTGAKIREFAHQNRVDYVAMTPDGAIVVTGSSDKTAQVWSQTTGQSLQLTGHVDSVSAVAISADGTKVVTGSSDKTAKVWNAVTGTLIAALTGHTDEITSLAVSPDGSRVLTGSKDKSGRLWNATTGAPLTVRAGHEGPVTAVAFSDGGARFVTLSEDKTVRIWDAETGEEIDRFGHRDLGTSLAIKPDGSEIFTTSIDNTIRSWQPQVGRSISLPTSIKAIAALPGYPRALIVSGEDSAPWNPRDNTAQIWDFERGEMLYELPTKHEWINSVAVVPDGSRIIAAFGDFAASEGEKVVRLWDGAKYQETDKFPSPGTAVELVTTSPDGSLLVGTSGEKAWVLDAQTGKKIGEFEGHQSIIYALAIAPDGVHVVTSSGDDFGLQDMPNDKTLRIWDIKTRKQLRDLPTPAKVSAIAITADRRLVAGLSDKIVRFWDIESGRLLDEISTGRKEAVGVDMRLALAPDGRQLVVANTFDRNVQIWDISDAKPIQRAELRGHKGGITSLAVTPDGQRVITGSIDQTVRVWKLLPSRQALIDQAKRAVPRCLTTDERELYFLPDEPPAWCRDMHKWPYDTESR